MVALFLSKLTGIKKEKLMNANYQGGELTKTNRKEKGKVSDIMVRITDNESIILEMNNYTDDDIFNKNSSYAYNVISESIKINPVEYPVTILINIDNMNKYNTKKPILNFKSRDEEGHIENDLYNSIHVILENVVNQEYNKDIDEDIIKVCNLINTKSIKQMKEKYEGDEIYMSTIKKIEDLARDEEFIGYYDYEERKQREMNSSYKTGVRVGREEGIEQGIEEGRSQIISKLIEFGISLDAISNATGLPLEEIKNINNVNRM